MTEKNSYELKAIVFLNRLMGGNTLKLNELLNGGVLPSEVLRLISKENLLGKKEAFNKIQNSFDAEREMELCQKMNVRLISRFDPDYPETLRTIGDAPALLYVRGNFIDLDDAAIAIVGSRHPSFYGLMQAKKFSRELAQAGLTVVSGFARGIDQVAHEAAIGVSYGRSIAVLGSGIDVVYPPENRKFMDQLSDQGAVVSEYALGTEPYARNFPIRNRIISGLSMGVLVVEAHARSGSLITAHEALEQGRDIFAVPGPVDQLTSKGTHRLIKEGAYLVESAQDVLEVLAVSLGTVSQCLPIVPPAEPKQTHQKYEDKIDEAGAELRSDFVSDEQAQDIVKALAEGPRYFEEITTVCAMTSGLKNAVLLELELKKKIRKERDGRFALC